MSISVTLIKSFPSEGQMAFFKFTGLPSADREQCKALANAHRWHLIQSSNTSVEFDIYAPYEKAKEEFKRHFLQESFAPCQSNEELEEIALHLSNPTLWAIKHIQNADELKGYLRFIRERAAGAS